MALVAVLLTWLALQVQHYAGDVLYDVKDWITKNKDPLQEDIAKALIGSKRAFIGNLFTDGDLDPRERLAQQKATALEAAGKKAAQSKGGASFLTVASAYKDQLADLMDTLRATEPNFIRCLIPNLQKKQQSLNAELILEQLACNGVLEGIRISRKGYPNRLKYPEFVKRYYLLHPALKVSRCRWPGLSSVRVCGFAHSLTRPMHSATSRSRRRRLRRS